MAFEALKTRMDSLVGNAANPWKVLAGLSGYVVVIAVLGGVVTRGNLVWYDALNKSFFIPPNWAFGPAWTVFFVLMTAAAWLVWRRLGWPASKTPLALWVFQLVLNLSWSTVFFAWHMLAGAFLVSLVFVAAVAVTTKSFFAADRTAGLLMLPVLAWVTFASVLSLSMWITNF
ncbi:tryptophan-rich sensory protein [Phaeovibrio sulfidiphilus]|uniref:Tryptophan-rich sensory protein n=1 Tax=Phaeovibrio sulfidiphilus TaxID=1220600 RepID=A0A8J6YH58_9PROT|nr:TspO/MBR family protein [Phaeovibrio sulfidiphilus]MBE1236216.1 tryptophan-rich sensory protein [Phaeovibrio sulfidiphilus]